MTKISHSIRLADTKDDTFEVTIRFANPPAIPPKCLGVDGTGQLSRAQIYEFAIDPDVTEVAIRPEYRPN